VVAKHLLFHKTAGAYGPFKVDLTSTCILVFISKIVITPPSFQIAQIKV